MGEDLGFQTAKEIRGAKLSHWYAMVLPRPSDAFVSDDEHACIIQSRAHALLEEKPVALRIRRACKHRFVGISGASKRFHRQKMRLLDLDRLVVGIFFIISNKQISEPWTRLLALET